MRSQCGLANRRFVSYDEELCRLAVANGSSAHEALGLATAVAHGVESLYAGPVKLRRSRSCRKRSRRERRTPGVVFWLRANPDRELIISRYHRALCATAAIVLAGLLGGAPAYAKTHQVREGESIQAAIDAAKPGETVVVHRGTYQESLLIDKDGIRLKGNHVRLHPPTNPNDTPCPPIEPVTGICVLGAGRPEYDVITDYVTGVRIKGFTIEHFSGAGILAFGSELLRVSHDKLLDNGGYGAFALSLQEPALPPQPL